MHQMSSCSCIPSGRILGNLDNILAHNQRQNEINEKLIRDIAARGLGRTSAEQSIESSINEIDKLTEKDNRILKTLKYDIDRANKRSTEIIRHQEQAAEAEREAKKRPLKFMAGGTKSDVYAPPEAFGEYVLQYGPRADIEQKRHNILCVSQASEKFHHSIWNYPKLRWLRPLLFPNIKEVIPTGWVGDVATGLVRSCENLDPRIPESYDADGNRISVDSNEQIGLVLSRIGDLEDTDRRVVLRRCFGLSDAEVKKVLDANEHCLIRIYLGRSSDDEELDDYWDSVSDVIMEDAPEEAEFTLFDKPLLPAFLDDIMNACEGTTGRHALQAFAREIAFGYALLHWGARLDGRGIEFLLGSSPTGVGKRLYMLDLEDCRPIGELTPRCVLDQLVPAALENDPYIPRPTTCGSIDETELRLENGWYREVFTHRSHQVYAWKVFVYYYLQASARIWEASDRDFHSGLPELFIKELKTKFFEQDAEWYADGVSDRYFASEDGAHHQTESYYAESEQGESGSQEDPEYDGDDEDDQSQDDRESFDNDQYGDDGYDSDAMDIDDSSEGEEVSDEDDDDYDDEF